jgi:Xaa-Pro dipeptidase
MNWKRAKEFFNLNKSIDALILKTGDVTCSLPNFFYFLEVEIDNAVLLMKRDEEPKLFVSEMNFEYAKETGIEVEKLKSNEFWGKIKNEIKKCKRVGIDKENLSATDFELMKKKIRKTSDVSKNLKEQRAVKEESEINFIAKATKLVREIANGLEIREGKTELEIANELQKEILERDSEISFKPIVLSGRNSRFPHGKPSSRKIKRGEIVLVDFGAKVGNYCSDITRCFFIGEGRGEQIEAYKEMQEIFKTVLSSIRMGMHAREVSRLAEEEFKKQMSYKPIHSIGHGIGLEVHEFPSFKINSKHILKKNMVFTIEPGYYGKNFGVRYEDVVVLRNRVTTL